MASRRLQQLETSFRKWRDRVLGRLLFNCGLTAKAFLRHLGKRGDLVLRSFVDHQLLIDPADHTVSYALMRGEAWQRDQLERAVAFLRKDRLLCDPGTFVDVGANIGTQTIYAMLTGAFAGSLSLEPEPRNFRILELNGLVNGLAGRITCRNCGAGDCDGELPLFLSFGNRAAHSFVRGADGTSGHIKAAVRRLDALVEEHAGPSPALIWIDVEGYEPQVLRGMPRLLEARVPLVIETNPHLYEGGMPALSGQLKPHYSHFVDVGDATLAEQPIEALANLTDQHDVLVYAR